FDDLVGDAGTHAAGCRPSWVRAPSSLLLSLSAFARCTHGRDVPEPDVSKCSKTVTYSITSSARASRVGGRFRPSALAVLRLMLSSNLVGCSTGKSAALTPRSTFTASRAT